MCRNTMDSALSAMLFDKST